MPNTSRKRHKREETNNPRAQLAQETKQTPNIHQDRTNLQHQNKNNHNTTTTTHHQQQPTINHLGMTNKLFFLSFLSHQKETNSWENFDKNSYKLQIDVYKQKYSFGYEFFSQKTTRKLRMKRKWDAIIEIHITEWNIPFSSFFFLSPLALCAIALPVVRAIVHQKYRICYKTCRIAIELGCQ